MRRRELLLRGGALVLLGGVTRAAAQTAMPRTPEAIAHDIAAWRAKALENFGFELVETTGDAALAKWEALKSAGRGVPVVLGGAESLDHILTPFGPNGPLVPPPPAVDSILAAAARITWPGDLAKQRGTDDADGLAVLKNGLAKNPNEMLPTIIETDGKGHDRTLSRDETVAQLEAPQREPPIGDWPRTADADPGLSVAYDLLKSTPLPKVYIALIPTDDWTTIPAYLRYGGWDDCPPPEYHVAALRAWRARYGAELIGLGFNTMNLRVARSPSTRDAAIALAKEQYIYCRDIIDQGVESYSALAAALMANTWWFFWWD